MNKHMDKLKSKTYNNKRILIFLFVLFFIGIIAGSIFITIISKQDQNLVRSYIEEFINNINHNKLNYFDALKNNILSNILFILIVFILGISIIGIPINIFMYFSKAFTLGFSISALILEFKFKGIILSLFYIFPHHIVNILAYTLIVMYSIKVSYRLINGILKKKTINFKPLINRYLKVLGICICVIVITSLYECFIVPFIFKRII